MLKKKPDKRVKKDERKCESLKAYVHRNINLSKVDETFGREHPMEQVLAIYI